MMTEGGEKPLLTHEELKKAFFDATGQDLEEFQKECQGWAMKAEPLEKLQMEDGYEVTVWGVPQ